MCGRYALTVDIQAMLDILMNRYNIKIALPLNEYRPRYNIAPGQQVLAVINDGKQHRAGMLHWGFIPPWAQEPSIGYKMINARSETLAEKPAFKASFQNRRCTILADSFYEWKKEKNRKVPMRVKLKNNQVFALAGLWTSWKPQDGDIVYSCSIITTTPNHLMAELHHRMPVILSAENEKLWLDPSIKDIELLKSLLTPYPSEEMEAYEVSTAVNSWRNDTPECILPVQKTEENSP